MPKYDEAEVKALAGKGSTPAQPTVLALERELSQAIATIGDRGDNRLSLLVAFLAEQEHKRLTAPGATISDLSHKLMGEGGFIEPLSAIER